MNVRWLVPVSLLWAAPAAIGQATPARPGAREIGLVVGVLPPGPLNAITDVAGVRIGHRTRIEGDGIRTGVTAIVPGDGNLFQQKVPAAVYVGNGHGKMTGLSQIEELGVVETPILLTNTLSVGTVGNALIRYTLDQPGNEGVRSVNPVVGETNDGTLNDIRRMAVTDRDALDAIASARAGPVAEGNVGAGTGTVAFRYKGGIGTSSRQVRTTLGLYNVGVLVQANYGRLLWVRGVPFFSSEARAYLEEMLPGGSRPPEPPSPGSCMVVVATDAPLDSRNLERLAKRAILALGRLGSPMANSSGEYAIAFTTGYRIPADGTKAVQLPALVSNDQMTPLFEAASEATEEAVYNALFKAETMQGYKGVVVRALPVADLRRALSRHKAIGGADGRRREPAATAMSR